MKDFYYNATLKAPPKREYGETTRTQTPPHTLKCGKTHYLPGLHGVSFEQIFEKEVSFDRSENFCY